MLKAIIILLTFIASSVFADTDRSPASFTSPDQIKAEISKLRAGAVGKDGRPNPKVVNDITKLENRLTELRFKKSNSSKR